mgnify:CR=1 FL=1
MTTHTIIIQGGLGNQLFQVFSLINYCIENNYKFIFPLQMQSWDKNRHSYWNSIFYNLKDYVKPNDCSTKFKEYNEPNFYYNEIPLFTTNSKLNGYFQSELYFKKHFEQICKILDIREKQDTIKKKYIDYENTIGLHFRMGDYDNPQYHPVMPDTYYINSLNYIINKTNKENWNVYYACEKEDDNKVLIRINNIQQYFKNLNFIKIPNDIEDYKQLLLMSVCEHNIIGNSSFSWWASYFNINNNKIVCYPSLWFGPKKKINNLNDLTPVTWNKINIK